MRREMQAQALYAQLRAGLDSGASLPGSRLPSERELAARYGMNRMAVKRVLQSLVEDGFLYRVQGRGTFVQKRPADRMNLGMISTREVLGITAILKRQGVAIENKVVGCGAVHSEWIARQLGLAPDAPIWGLYRLRRGNGVPCAMEYTYLPAAFFPDFEQTDFDRVSLYAFFEAAGHRVVGGRQVLQIVQASDQLAALLEIAPGAPLYKSEFCERDRDGTAVEYTESYTRPDKTEMHFRAHTPDAGNTGTPKRNESWTFSG